MPNVLEIGAGDYPAIKLPGEVLLEPDVEYFAVDAWEKKPARAFSDEKEQAEYMARVTITNGATLPFEDGSMTDVFMRSVFGEYTMRPERTGSSHDNTFATLYEAFRVLEVNGQIAIAEENTPWEASAIGDALLCAGFDDITVYPCENMQNSHWVRERTKYWGLEQGYCPPRLGYLVCAVRPDVEVETFQRAIALPDAIRANRERGSDHPNNKVSHQDVTLQRSVRELPKGLSYDYGLLDQFSLIKVVTKDEEFDLQTYDRLVEEGQKPQLFEI